MIRAYTFIYVPNTYTFPRAKKCILRPRVDNLKSKLFSKYHVTFCIVVDTCNYMLMFKIMMMYFLLISFVLNEYRASSFFNQESETL